VSANTRHEPEIRKPRPVWALVCVLTLALITQIPHTTPRVGDAVAPFPLSVELPECSP
jgi:hypothetical protein